MKSKIISASHALRSHEHFKKSIILVSKRIVIITAISVLANFVVANDRVTLRPVKQIVKGINVQPLFKSEMPARPLSDKEKHGLDIEVIKGGGKINITNLLGSGKITIFDFYADWCGPCRAFSPKVERLIENNPNVALRKVDIVTWKSEVSRQLAKKYQMSGLPFILVFDDNGKLLGIVEGNYIEKVEQIIKENAS